MAMSGHGPERRLRLSAVNSEMGSEADAVGRQPYRRPITGRLRPVPRLLCPIIDFRDNVTQMLIVLVCNIPQCIPERLL
jgi:hypothetical protein